MKTAHRASLSLLTLLPLLLVAGCSDMVFSFDTAP